jgi:hypothetical protein
MLPPLPTVRLLLTLWRYLRAVHVWSCCHEALNMDAETATQPGIVEVICAGSGLARKEDLARIYQSDHFTSYSCGSETGRDRMAIFLSQPQASDVQ